MEMLFCMFVEALLSLSMPGPKIDLQIVFVDHNLASPHNAMKRSLPQPERGCYDIGNLTQTSLLRYLTGYYPWLQLAFPSSWAHPTRLCDANLYGNPIMCPAEPGKILRCMYGENWNLTAVARDNYWAIGTGGDDSLHGILEGRQENVLIDDPTERPTEAIDMEATGQYIRETLANMPLEELLFLSKDESSLSRRPSFRNMSASFDEITAIFSKLEIYPQMHLMEIIARQPLNAWKGLMDVRRLMSPCS